MTTSKYSSAMTNLAAKLRDRYTEAFEAAPTAGELTVDFSADQLNQVFDGYTTTLRDGTERGLTAQEFEAASNFRRDFSNAHSLVAGELGYARLESSADLDSVMLTANLTPSLSITSGTYRPGQELAGEESYTSLTDTFTEDADFKAMRETLKGLSEKFTRAN